MLFPAIPYAAMQAELGKQMDITNSNEQALSLEEKENMVSLILKS